jgi:hypothetical protein
MAELVDALDLGSSFSRSEGSSPFVRIRFNKSCSIKKDAQRLNKSFGQASPARLQEQNLPVRVEIKMQHDCSNLR